MRNVRLSIFASLRELLFSRASSLAAHSCHASTSPTIYRSHRRQGRRRGAGRPEANLRTGCAHSRVPFSVGMLQQARSTAQTCIYSRWTPTRYDDATAAGCYIVAGAKEYSCRGSLSRFLSLFLSLLSRYSR